MDYLGDAKPRMYASEHKILNLYVTTLGTSLGRGKANVWLIAFLWRAERVGNIRGNADDAGAGDHASVHCTG